MANRYEQYLTKNPPTLPKVKANVNPFEGITESRGSLAEIFARENLASILPDIARMRRRSTIVFTNLDWKTPFGTVELRPSSTAEHGYTVHEVRRG